MICSNKIERILLFFTLKKASNEKGGIIQILGLNLTPIQQVLSNCFIFSNLKYLIILYY